ncbi:MAG TPA: SRPBCC family protein [Chthoniobacteraceae bacterium]|jgi:uncharacterized membrane protein|nr:SRPBCC family protein [Chthoniobacteraceae bacterium]
MQRIEKDIEVNEPLSTVYNQWTQFESFPHFMEGVKSVRQLDDRHLAWRAEILGREVDWEAEIIEQVPDECIAWRCTSGHPNMGAVYFEPLGPDRTKVTLVLEYEPLGAAEKIADALGALSIRVEGDLRRFKKFIEERGAETGAWRGEIYRGSVT